MKKVLVALVMVLGTGSSVVFAQEVNNSSAIVAEVTSSARRICENRPDRIATGCYADISQRL